LRHTAEPAYADVVTPEQLGPALSVADVVYFQFIAKRFMRRVRNGAMRRPLDSGGVLTEGDTKMTFATVKVQAPLNRLIYINGDYAQSAGNSLTDSFLVPTGGQIFETLNAARQVDYRKEFTVTPDQLDLTIELDRVTPPEQV